MTTLTPKDIPDLEPLCRCALNDGPQASSAATKEIFTNFIEPLCDDFSDNGVNTCNKILIKLLDKIRTTKQGAELDKLLNESGFSNSQDILNRYQRISVPTPIPPDDRVKLQKIIILSRVTAGADIAITSIIIRRLSLAFPQADLILIGPSHLAEIFADIPRCRCINFIYKNDGSLLERMTSWPRLREIIDHESQGLSAGEMRLFDPDTRLTQLGLLPLVADQYTHYFPSRSEPSPELSRSNLSVLTDNWLNQILGEEPPQAPALLFQSDGDGYNSFCNSLKERGCRCVTTINFGVGNDPKKKLSPQFEEELLFNILATRQTIIVLDSGRGPQEHQRVRHLLNEAGKRGISTGFINARELSRQSEYVPFNHGLLAFRGSLGSLGKMISASDCFIGYDSCGQHLAAATGTTAVIIFAGAPSSRFIERWSPTAQGNITIPVDTTGNWQEYQTLIEQINRIMTRLLVN